MTSGPRYALYYVPPHASALARFGAGCVGSDIWSGEPVPVHAPLETLGASANLAEPARYGFHATLKAPFHLAPGVTEQDLRTAVAHFAATRNALVLGRLEVRALQRFLALMPVAPPRRALADLASACVTTFDPMRAPLAAADRARRLAMPLTERQRTNLEAWGYPHVFDDFRFHMTLTGPLGPPERSRTQEVLQRLWAAVDAPVTLDGLAIAIQPERTARFRVLAHVPFRPADAT